jgi:hypothetical protein
VSWSTVGMVAVIWIPLAVIVCVIFWPNDRG